MKGEGYSCASGVLMKKRAWKKRENLGAGLVSGGTEITF